MTGKRTGFLVQPAAIGAVSVASIISEWFTPGHETPFAGRHALISDPTFGTFIEALNELSEIPITAWLAGTSRQTGCGNGAFGRYERMAE